MSSAPQSLSAVKAEGGLTRAIGVWGLAAAIFNTTVGGGIFRLPSVAAEMMGAAAPVAYVVCAIAMGLIALCFAEAGSRVSLTGGPYAYVELVFGKYAGFLAGVLLWLLGTTAVASVASALAAGLGVLLPALASPLPRAMLLAAIFAVLAGVNVTGVKQGTRLIEVVSVAKLFPLLLLVAIGAFMVTPANLAMPAMPHVSTLSRTAIVLIFAFTGVESALVPAGEMKNPSRTVPRALAIGMIGVMVLYLAIQSVAQGVLGAPALAAAKAAPLAAVGEALMGPSGRLLLLIGAAISMFGYVAGMTLAMPRALYAYARDGFLPRGVGAVHARFHTPWVAIIAQSMIVCALAVGNEFETLAVLANLSALLLYFACAVAGWELRRRGIQDAGSTPFSLPGGPLVPILACGVIVWLLTSITGAEWRSVGIVLLAATVLFFFRRK